MDIVKDDSIGGIVCMRVREIAYYIVVIDHGRMFARHFLDRQPLERTNRSIVFVGKCRSAPQIASCAFLIAMDQ